MDLSYDTNLSIFAFPLMCLVFTLPFFSMNIIQIMNTIKVTGPPFVQFWTKKKTCIQQEASKIHGVPKKTSFSQNCPWQILLLIMRNPLSFFMTNVGDSFCNSYIYHLVGLHISDIGKEISSLVTCWGLWTATVRHSWAALWVLVIDPPQS